LHIFHFMDMSRALDVEDRIDTLDRLDRERRQHRERPACLGSDVGKLEELAPAVCPATRLRDRSRFALGLVEPIKAGIGIGLQDPGIAGATADTLALGSSEAATSRSFSAALQRRRRSTDVITSIVLLT
jgi:hypothetical protein